jgi:acyl-CoA synthetase (NDP forming)/GNAT superfamily N-acetyltransferase
MPATGTGRSFALLADGTTMTIRAARPDDYRAVKRLHENMSPQNLYLRFFNLSRLAPEQEARRVTRTWGPGHGALLGLIGDELAGVASYELIPGTATAEVAFAVADSLHGRGIATLLLEHLVSLAGAGGIAVLAAEALPDNSEMLRVFADAGLAVRRRSGDGVVQLSMPVPQRTLPGAADTYLEAVADRDRQADTASLTPLLAPRSVAVAGDFSRPGGARTILHNIRAGGFTGPLHAVTRQARVIGGIPCVPSLAALPGPPDLVILADPAAGVLELAAECAAQRVRSLVVTTHGLNPEQEQDLLDTARRGGMRLVGPDSLGLSVPVIGLNATLAAHPATPGRIGLVAQSRGLGAALMDRLSGLGLGVSSFVSVGRKLDVSTTDLLMWWDADDTTALAVLSLESFGNPRRFAREARRVAPRLPLLTVHAGWSVPGQGAARSPAGAAAPPLITRQALFDQAGVIATTSFTELLDVAALIATQPVPAGRRVAVLANSSGAGALAADACADAGLEVVRFSPETASQLADALPPGAAVGGPVDVTPAAGPGEFRAALDIAAGADGVDALIALLVRDGSGYLVPAVTTGGLPVPVTAVILDQPESVRLLRGPGTIPPVPAYASPEAAVRALGRAARYGTWRSRPPGAVPGFSDLRVAEAGSIADAFLARIPGGGWLSDAEAADLLRCYGLPVAGAGPDTAPPPPATPPATAPAPAPAASPAGHRCLTELFAAVVQEPVFGPVVEFGLGGIAADVLGDHAARLAPLTDTDADDLIHSIRAAPVLLGDGGRPAVHIPAVREVLLRVSQLADQLPQVAELELSPLLAGPDGVTVLGARIRVTSPHVADPFLRQLPR